MVAKGVNKLEVTISRPITTNLDLIVLKFKSYIILLTLKQCRLYTVSAALAHADVTIYYVQVTKRRSYRLTYMPYIASSYT